MSKLINVDRLKKDILALPNCYNGFSDTYDKSCIIGVIDEQPTIEPKKGRWITKSTNGEMFDVCSVCGYVEWDEPKNFCSNCGADMRGEADG